MSEVKEPKKRVLFPWLKKHQGRAYKCSLALIADKEGFEKVIKGDIAFNAHLKMIVDKTNTIFPSMYKMVRKFYNKRGRELSKKEFIMVAVARLTFMFKYEKENKEVIRLPEHPNNAEKLKSIVNFCERLIKSEKTYKIYRTETEPPTKTKQG
jgi:hypothetical protein